MKIEKIKNNFTNLIQMLELAISDGFTILDDDTRLSNEYKLGKYIKPDKEGFYLIINNLGYYIEYQHKCPESGNYLRLNLYQKDFDKIIEFQKQCLMQNIDWLYNLKYIAEK